jgi:hypothetical protein
MRLCAEQTLIFEAPEMLSWVVPVYSLNLLKQEPMSNERRTFDAEVRDVEAWWKV